MSQKFAFLPKPLLTLGRTIKNKPRFYMDTNKKLRTTNQRRLILFATPNSGNLGDHAITEGVKTFIEDHFPNELFTEFSIHQYQYEKEHIQRRINDEDVIMITGGGFLGNLWMTGENTARDVIERFPNNKIIIFPHTMFFDERFDKEKELAKSVEIYNRHPHLTFFLREEQSYQFVQEHFPNITVKKAPDIVTYLNESKIQTERNGALFCLRNDKEKVDYSYIIDDLETHLSEAGVSYSYTDTLIDIKANEKNRKHYLEQKYTEFRQSRVVITDRLHGMIFALITGTPCIAFNNSSGKVRGVYEWIKSVDYIVCVDEENLNDIDFIKNEMNRLLTIKVDGYDNHVVLDHFKPLVEELRK